MNNQPPTAPVTFQNITDLQYKDSVSVATVTTLTIGGGGTNWTYAETSSGIGVGATLTYNTNAASSDSAHTTFFDGVTLALNDRILVKNADATKQHNGIYTCTSIGSGSSKVVLTRANDYDNSSECIAGTTSFVVVTNGTTLANTGYYIGIGKEAATTTFGTTTFTVVSPQNPATTLSGLTASITELNILDESAASADALSAPEVNVDGVLTYDSNTNTISWKTLATVCFLKGTKITLPDKSQKNIEDLKLGDFVLTYKIDGLSDLKKDDKAKIMNWSNEDMNGEFSKNRVKNIWVNPTDRYLVINDKLRITNLHIIHVKRGDEYKFLPAEKAEIGDFLFTDSGEYERISDIKQVHEKTEVYNIEVRKAKTYFAENYLVHHFCETCSGLSGRI